MIASKIVVLLLLVLCCFATAEETNDFKKLAKGKGKQVKSAPAVADGSGQEPTSPTSSLSPPSTTSNGPDTPCVDLLLCDAFTAFCKQSLYAGFVNVFCRKTCKLCETKCFDHNPLQCQIWAEDGSCKSPLLSVFATKMCAKSCNACE